MILNGGNPCSPLNETFSVSYEQDFCVLNRKQFNDFQHPVDAQRWKQQKIKKQELQNVRVVMFL